MLRGRFAPRSLPARVFWLIVGIILLVELLAITPGLSSERHFWLVKRVTEARVAAVCVGASRDPVSPQMRDAMLRISDTVAITLEQGQSDISLVPEHLPARLGPDIDLDKEDLLTGMWRADIAVLGQAAPFARVRMSWPPAKEQIEIIVSQRDLALHLQRFLAFSAVLAAILAVVTASLVFAALNRLLVRPLQVMTAGIAGFRRNPGYAGAGGLKWLAGRGDDEISRAARELVTMQDELRADLWRNARLAALGTAVAKISHDLRNILTSALLVGDRLHRHNDPMVRQAANTLIPAMERAVELVSRTVDFAQEGPPGLTRSPVEIQVLVNEVAEMLHAADASVAFANLVPGTLVLSLDRNQIYRALINLLRNSVEAGATRITLKLENEKGMALLVITDNGPGLPGPVIPKLFRPFAGTGRSGGAGLGLTIARDLIRAHGGDLSLRHTGPEGTVFVVSLPLDLPDESSGMAIAG